MFGSFNITVENRSFLSFTFSSHLLLTQSPHSLSSALRAKPNAAHYALAQFTSPEVRAPFCPPNSTFTIISQNVDGLSPKALKEVSTSVTIPEETAERPHIIEMHGRLFDVCCSGCRHIVHNTNSPLCEALAGTEKSLGSDDFEVDIPLDKLPRCENCGELARPGVVWFGEVPWHLDLNDKLAQEADLCLIVGTSSTVSRVESTVFLPISYALQGLSRRRIC